MLHPRVAWCGNDGSTSERNRLLRLGDSSQCGSFYALLQVVLVRTRAYSWSGRIVEKVVVPFVRTK
jgi:hypothetical protein